MTGVQTCALPILLQVHDELVVEAPVADVEKVSAYIKQTMEGVYTLNVPIEVGVGVGMNWGTAK